MASADRTATYSIDLKDGTSGAAESAAQALNHLRSSIDGDTKAIAGMKRALKNLEGGSVQNVKQMDELRKKIDAKRRAVAEAQSAYIGLGGSFTRGARPARDTAGLFAQIGKNASAAGGPIGAMGARLTAVSGIFAGGAFALGVTAVAVALVALVAAAGLAVAALYRYAVAQGDARRSELLRLEGMTKLRNWYGLAAGSSKELQGAIDEVSASTALGRSKVAEYTEQLYKMGLRGRNLKVALEGMTMASSVLGEEHGGRFAGMAAQAAFYGDSVDRLTDRVKARLGGVAAAQMLSLSVQAEKARESFAALFHDLRVEGLLSAVQTLASLLSQSTETGKALKVLVTTMFQPMIDATEHAAPLVKRFFQGATIAGLTFGIAVLKVRNWLRDTFAGSSILEGLSLQKAAVYAGAAAFGAFAGAITLVTGLIAIAAAPFAVFATLLTGLTVAARKIYEVWTGIKWGDLGNSIVDGIVNGVKSRAKFAVDAVASLGSQAWAGFKNRLGISSPSKEFAKLGVAIPQGVESGIAKGTPRLESAVDDMAGVRLPRGQEGAPSSSGSSTTHARTLSIGELHIHAGSSSQGQDIERSVRRALEQILEGAALQSGAGGMA